jgi:hypothetical protein
VGPKLITACTYVNSFQAEMARMALAQAGIQSWVNGSLMAASSALGFSNHVNGVQLDIDEKDAEAAWEVLNADPRLLGAIIPASSELDDTACLSCNAPMSEEEIECKKCGWTFAIERSEEDEDAEDEKGE